MNIKYCISRAKKMKISTLVNKVIDRLFLLILDSFYKCSDITFIGNIRKVTNPPLRFINNQYDKYTLSHSNVSSLVIDNYLEHKFDLLGSGWVTCSYESMALGFEGIEYSGNVEYSKYILLPKHRSKFEVLSAFISPEYVPIDWQKDFKSGYRWSQFTWYKDCFQDVGVKAGVDIKVPWELSRMQHLPLIAIKASQLEANEKNKLIVEVCDQIIDFISANPVRFGANWACAMDVGLRAANILLAYDILQSIDSDGIIDPKVTSIIAESMFEHGEHIAQNLEWSKEHRHNHYLSDVAGLLFISSYLEGNPVIDTWLAFSVQELLNCIEEQFHNDGSNFEASTSYHRLSSEIVGYSIARLLGLDRSKVTSLENYNSQCWKKKPKLEPLEKQKYNITEINGTKLLNFDVHIIEKLSGIAKFTASITKPNNEVCQVGDNDSGRFFHLSNNGEIISNERAESQYLNLKGYGDSLIENDLYWDENILDHRSLISLYKGIFEQEFDVLSTYNDFESLFVKLMTKGRTITAPAVKTDLNFNDKTKPKLDFKYIKKIDIPRVKIEDINVYYYPDFGIYVFKSSDFYLSVFFGDVGQGGIGGHSHNDKLSFELQVKGVDYFRDPGTYIYTASVSKRNEFRSILAHNSPKVRGGEEPCSLSLPFQLESKLKCELLTSSNNSLSVSYIKDSVVIIRSFDVLEEVIIVTDESNVELENLNVSFEYYSPGYGKLISNKPLVIL